MRLIYDMTHLKFSLSLRIASFILLLNQNLPYYPTSACGIYNDYIRVLLSNTLSRFRAKCSFPHANFTNTTGTRRLVGRRDIFAARHSPLDNIPNPGRTTRIKIVIASVEL